MAWNRVIELSVGTAGKGLLISDLHIDFSIERSVNGSENSAVFTIYNSKQDTRSNLLASGNNVIFKAGYEDESNVHTIFVGTIIESITTKEGTDYLTKIRAIDYSDNKKGFDYLTFSLSYKEKTPFNSVISDIAGTLGIPVAGLNNVTSTLNNGFNYSGNFKNLIKKVKNQLNVDGVDLYFDNNEMLIYKVSAISSFDLIKLTSKTGLIMASQVNDDSKEDGKKRITVDCLLNPKFKPHSLIKVESENINGSFFIEKVSFNGNNYGGDFNCKLECIE